MELLSSLYHPLFPVDNVADTAFNIVNQFMGKGRKWKT